MATNTNLDIKADGNRLIDQFAGYFGLGAQKFLTFFHPIIACYKAEFLMYAIQKIDERARKKGFSPRKVKLAVGIPILESAVLEEQKELQELWANFFVNAVDSSVPESMIRPAFTDIIKALSPSDAKLLARFSDQKIIDMPACTNEDEISLNNLVRLGCLDHYTDKAAVDLPDGRHYMPIFTTKYYITALGEAFLKICIQPDPDTPLRHPASTASTECSITVDCYPN